MVWLLMVAIVWFSQLIQWRSCLVEDKVEAEHRELVLASFEQTADAVKFPAGESCLLARLCDAGNAARLPSAGEEEEQLRLLLVVLGVRLSVILDGFNSQCFALQLRLLPTKLVIDLCPKLFDLLGRCCQPDGVEQVFLLHFQFENLAAAGRLGENTVAVYRLLLFDGSGDVPGTETMPGFSNGNTENFFSNTGFDVVLSHLEFVSLLVDAVHLFLQVANTKRFKSPFSGSGFNPLHETGFLSAESVDSSTDPFFDTFLPVLFLGNGERV